MSVTEDQILNDPPAPVVATAAAPATSGAAPRSCSTPRVIMAIEYNLPTNYRRRESPEYGYSWIYARTRTNLSARIYPIIDSDTISVSIFDDSKNTNLVPNQSERINQWSGHLRMVGDWRRRLRRMAGEAVTLVNQRPTCPRCRRPMVLRERESDKQQFFGCPTFPQCKESITIIDYDLDNKKTEHHHRTRSSVLPAALVPIEYNLPPNYERLKDNERGFYWIYRVDRTMLSARVCPNPDGSSIKISIFDDSKNPELLPDRSPAIKLWSTDLRITGAWAHRLRRAAGEGLVLANTRPRCPLCRTSLVLRERETTKEPFFGCPNYPTCDGSISIINHDLDKRRAGSYRPQAEQNVSQQLQKAS